MDRNYIDLHLLADRYLQGALAESEKAEFEERLVWDQELIDELDLAERLSEGLQQAVVEDGYAAADGANSIFAQLSDLFRIPQYAAAASFLLAITLAAGVFMSPLMLESNRGDDAMISTNVVPLIALRSTTVPTIRVDGDAWTVLLVDIVGSYDSYRVIVRRDGADMEPIWRKDTLLPTYLGALAVGMPGSLLGPGRYVLSVEGVRRSEAGETIHEHVQNLIFETAPAD